MNDAPTPAFSVVIPAFNAAATIERSVRAIVDQEVTDWELIVVDDHSEDGTGELVAALQEANPGCRIELIRHERNRGVAAARNSGIDRATGSYIAFVDSDDECLPNYLATFLAEFRDGVDAVLIGHEVVATGGRVTTLASVALGTFDGPTAVRLAMLDRLTPFPWDKAFRRSIFADVRFPEGLARFEDMMTNIVLYSRARLVSSVSTPGYRYFIGGDSLTWGRIPAIEESTSAAEYLVANLPPGMATGRNLAPLAAMRVLMTMLVAQTAIARGRGSAHSEAVVRASRRAISWNDARSTLTVSPRIAVAAALIKAAPGLYSKLYRRHVQRSYGVGRQDESDDQPMRDL